MEAADMKCNIRLSLEMSDRGHIYSPKTLSVPKKKIEKTDKNVSVADICIVVSSLITYLIDTVTDLLVAAQYLHAQNYMWGVLTLVFVLVPSIIIQIFSGRWYAADGKMKGCRCWVLHFFLLQPLERYLFVVVSGLEARRTKLPHLISEYYYQHNDVSMLRLFEAFLESAPQLTLQIYVMFCTDSSHWLTVTSASISLLALGWAVAAYSHALRKAYRDSYKTFWPSLVLQTVWHIGVVAARVVALVVFASVFKFWVCLVIGVHWMLMTVWIVLQNTDFCPTRCEEFLFDCTIGIVYNFSFFNLKEGQTRWRIILYFSLMFVENSALVGVWYPYRHHAWYDLPLLIAMFAMFFVGICCMILYYRFCHPSGPISCKSRPKDATEPELDEPIGPPITRPPQYQSTPALRQAQGVAPRSPVTKVPRLLPMTSTISLPRRALLKTQLSSKLNVQYLEVSTPSQLSPIKQVPINDTDLSHRNVYADCTTLQLDEASAYRHFSVDASACFRVSKCHTLEGTGVDLSRASLLDGHRSEKRMPRPTYIKFDEESLSGMLPSEKGDDSSDHSFCSDLEKSPSSGVGGSPLTSDPSSTTSGSDSGHCTEQSNSEEKRLDNYYTPIDLSLCMSGSPQLRCAHPSLGSLSRETHLIRDAETL